MDMTLANLIGAWLSIGLTLCIFSFLYADNPVYKLAEHLYLGVSIGFSCIEVYYGVLQPNMFDALAEGQLMRLVPLAMFVMLFMKLSKRFSYLARIPIAFIMAAYAGVKLTGEASGSLMTQVAQTMPDLAEVYTEHGFWNWEADGDGILSALFLVFGLAACLLHFYFSAPHNKGMQWVSRFGILVLMLSFGASFGYTVMGRITLCIGRFQEMLGMGRTADEIAYFQPTVASLVLLAVLGIYLFVWTVRTRAAEPE